MKKYIYILFLCLFAWACTDPDDIVTGDAMEGAGLVDISKSSGKFLGAPIEGTDSIDIVSDSELSFVVEFANGKNSGLLDHIEVVKMYVGANITGYDSIGDPITTAVNSEEIIVDSFTAEDTPYTVTLDSEDDFYEGTGINKSDLTVGDAFIFRTKMFLKDGRVLYAAPGDGEYTVTVSCFSDLAGEYTTAVTRDDGSSGTFDQTIEETKPGEYITTRSGLWAPTGVLATPTGEAPLIFSDICSQLFVPDQTLGQFYSNEVGGVTGPDEVSGSVDLITGVITLQYTILLSGTNYVYTEVLTPKN